MPDNEIISLMMVTYNRLNLTKETLQSIANTIKSDFNFIVIDNGSTDGTVEFLNNFDDHFKSNHLKEIKIILNSENKGIAKGRNQALKTAVELNTDWFVTLDNDVLLPENWLEDCIDVLKANPNYGTIGVSFEPIKYTKIKLNGIEFEHKEKGNCGTACMVFNKKVQKMVGYFTTEYQVYGEEDSDISWRMRIAGFKVGYILNHGKHIGEGENDTGEYRQFKDECRKKNLEKFYLNCRLYAARKKPIYIPYKD